MLSKDSLAGYRIYVHYFFQLLKTQAPCKISVCSAPEPPVALWSLFFFFANSFSPTYCNRLSVFDCGSHVVVATLQYFRFSPGLVSAVWLSPSGGGPPGSSDPGSCANFE